MANFWAEKGVCIGGTRGGSPGEGRGAGGWAWCGGRRRVTSHTAEEFLGRVRIFRIGLIPPRLTDLGHGSTHRLHQLARNFGKEPRRRGSAELLLIAENAAIHGARESKRFSCARHSDVHQPALFLNALLFVQRTAMWGDAFFHSSQEHMVELQALGAVQRDQRNAGFTFKHVRVADQGGGVKKVGKRFPIFYTFRDG